MGGSAAEVPTSPDEQPPPASGLRASDAERDQVVAKLKDEFVAGRLSHDTFLHRVNVVFESRRQSELPPLVADLPAEQPGNGIVRWLRGTWSRVAGAAGHGPGAGASTGTGGPGGRQARSAGQKHGVSHGTVVPARKVVRRLTTSMTPAPGRRQPFVVQFPRGGGDQFSIGRDASCDLAIADMTVSRLHAQLERTPEGWLLSDLESRNGTRVNGWLVRGKVPVGAGDLVSFGSLDVIFAAGQPEIEPPA
jgi:hypothetical protein